MHLATPSLSKHAIAIGSAFLLMLSLRGLAKAQELPKPSDSPIELSDSFRLPSEGVVARISDERKTRSRLQGSFPPELILPPPTEASKRKAGRFIPSTIDPELPLRLVVGRPKILQLADTPKRIYTPSDTIIRTEIIDEDSGKEVAVFGLKPGTTTLIFWFGDDDAPGGQSTVAYEVRVYADPLLALPTKDLEKELNEKFPNSYIELDELADRLIVRGQVPDTQEMAQILRVLTGARGVSSSISPTSTRESVFQASDATGFSRQELFDFQDSLAKRTLDPQRLAQAGIINQLTVVGEQQVMLKVTVAEVNRSAARNIGLNFSANDNNGLNVFQTLNSGAGNAGNTQGGANVLASLDMGQIRLAIEALRRLNLSRTLAEPNLVAMNGETADFQAGGQFPIPVISSAGGGGNNLQGVSFVPLGVQLEFTPFIQDRDVIQLRMNAEVSTRDESLGTNVGGGQVSGLNSRNFSTTVQIRSGQTIAVAGLLQTNYGASSDRIPLWGDLPLIGSTGGTNRSSSGEQELVILVTPHLVSPIDSTDEYALPGSDVYEPTDIEFYIANRLESRRSRDYRASVRTDYARQARAEECCPEKYMFGQVGPTDRCNPRRRLVPHRPIPSIRQNVPDDMLQPSIVRPPAQQLRVEEYYEDVR